MRSVSASWGGLLVSVVLSTSFPALAAGPTIPPCKDSGKPISIDNQQVLHWKRETANQFLARAHVLGQVDRMFADHSGHTHFEIKLGDQPDDTLEVIYNQDFGTCPDVFVGMKVEACGDYITSIAQSGPYPPSPSGAIIHWVHVSPNERRHDSGFLVMNGKVCGTDLGGAHNR